MTTKVTFEIEDKWVKEFERVSAHDPSFEQTIEEFAHMALCVEIELERSRQMNNEEWAEFLVACGEGDTFDDDIPF